MGPLTVLPDNPWPPAQPISRRASHSSDTYHGSVTDVFGEKEVENGEWLGWRETVYPSSCLCRIRLHAVAC